MIPTWIFDLLAAFMLVVAAVSAARLVAAQPWRHGSVIIDTDIAHLLMAIAMAGVLAPGLSTLPNAAWEVIFGVMIVWFAFRVVRDARANGVRALAGGHCAPHLVHSGAMLYMFLGMTSAAGAMAGMAGMPGMPRMSAGSSSMLMLSDPTLAFVFALVLIGYSIWDLDQLSGRRYSLTSAPVELAAFERASRRWRVPSQRRPRRFPDRTPRAASRTPAARDQSPPGARPSPRTAPRHVPSAAVPSGKSSCRLP